MIITISGPPGSGKSTVGKLLAKKLNYDYYSTGTLMRDYAKKHNLSLSQISLIAEKDHKIDKYIDNKQKELSKSNNIIVDGRISFYFIPNSIKIFIDANLSERVKRIFHANRSDETFSIEKIKKEIINRQKSEQKRFLKYYNIDPYDITNYDIIIDSTNLSVEEIVKKIIKIINENYI